MDVPTEMGLPLKPPHTRLLLPPYAAWLPSQPLLREDFTPAP